MARIALPFPAGRAAPARASITTSPAYDERAPLARLALGWVVIGLLFAGGLLSLYLVQMSSVSIAGYDLERLEEERQTWLSRNQQLEVELAKRRSLPWVEAQAIQRFGMTRAEKPVFITVTPQFAEDDPTPRQARDRGARSNGARANRASATSPIAALGIWWSDIASRRP